MATSEIQNAGWWGDDIEDDESAVLRFQQVLLEAAEGARDGKIDSEYQQLRRALIAHPVFKDHVPRFVRQHRDLVSMWPFFKSFNPQWEPRRQMVRGEFRPVLDLAEESSVAQISASSWTGISNKRERLIAIKALVPVAQAGVETLIATLDIESSNGGPMLDSHAAAIGNLRALHIQLGVFLDIAEEGKLESSLGKGALLDVAKYAKRAARELRDDAMPYAVSGLLLAVLSSLGVPTLGAYLAGVAMNIRKTTPRN